MCGTGTCIGEIPPYWMARAARLAAIEAGGKGESKGGDVPEELEVNSKYWIVNRVKGELICLASRIPGLAYLGSLGFSCLSTLSFSHVFIIYLHRFVCFLLFLFHDVPWAAKMIHFLRSYGFLGVFIMAAWPNFAFDLCGICCGHFLMSFW